MKDYSKGKIYTIRCITDDTLIYVGSTIQALCERLAGHKRSCKYEDRLLYSAVNENWDNWKIELHSLYPCSCVEELRRKEGEIIREIGTLNMEIAGRTKKEHYQDNKEKILKDVKNYQQNNKEKVAVRKHTHYVNNIEVKKEKDKEYYDNNRDKILERSSIKMTCECGCNILKYGYNRHIKSKKHLNSIHIS